MQKLKFIYSLRGFAVLGVILVHCTQFGHNVMLNNHLLKIAKQGSLGVQLFFIASAMTLFLSFESRKLKEGSTIFNFYIRRFFRIAPIYYLGIIYYLWQNSVEHNYFLYDHQFITITNVMTNICFIHAFDPYSINSVVPGGWTIGCEMIFYLLLPLIFKVVNSASKAYFFLLFTLILRFVLNYIVYHYNPNKILGGDFIHYYLPNQLPTFAVGIVLYFVIIKNESIKFTESMLLMTVSVIFIQLSGFQILVYEFSTGIVLFVFFILFLSRTNSTLFINKFIMYLGEISYSMYIVQFAVLYWLTKLHLIDYFDCFSSFDATLNFGIRFLLVVLITMSISSVTYRMIEIPMQSVGKKIISFTERKRRLKLDQLI